MSKVKIKGNSSGNGVLTIEAPNTNDDSTITLPDGTGELIQADASGNVGIGITPDDAKLQVSGNVFVGDAASDATIDNNLTSGGLDVAVGSGTKAFQVWDDSSTATPRFIVERTGNVGIGVTDPDATFEVANSTTDYAAHFGSRVNATGDNVLAITSYDENPSNTSYLIRCTTNTGDAGAGNDRFAVMADGRGLSEFTAKAWANFNGTNTSDVRATHNVSSITDVAVGRWKVNFTNNLANWKVCQVWMSGEGGSNSGSGTITNDGSSTSFMAGSCRDHNNSNLDRPYITAIAFGD